MTQQLRLQARARAAVEASMLIHTAVYVYTARLQYFTVHAQYTIRVQPAYTHSHQGIPT